MDHFIVVHSAHILNVKYLKQRVFCVLSTPDPVFGFVELRAGSWTSFQMKTSMKQLNPQENTQSE